MRKKRETKGIDPEVLRKLNAMPCQPPRLCERCNAKLHYWIKRDEQERKMGWPISGVKYIFCCPNCGKWKC